MRHIGHVRYITFEIMYKKGEEKRRKMKKWIMTGKEIRNEGRKRRSFPRIPEVKTGRRQMKISTMKMRKAAKLSNG